MKSVPVKGDLYKCFSCSQVTDCDGWYVSEYYCHDTSEENTDLSNSYETFFTSDCELVTFYQCPECGANDRNDPESFSQAWKCSHCEILWEYKDEGDDCCK